MGLWQSNLSEINTNPNPNPNPNNSRHVLCKRAEMDLQGIEVCIVYDKMMMKELLGQASGFYKKHRENSFGWSMEADPTFIRALGIEHRRWFSCFIHYTQCIRDDECAEIARTMIHVYQRMITPRIENRVFFVETTKMPVPSHEKNESESEPESEPKTLPKDENKDEIIHNIVFPKVPSFELNSKGNGHGGNDDDDSSTGNGGGGIAERADAPSAFPNKERKKISDANKN